LAVVNDLVKARRLLGRPMTKNGHQNDHRDRQIWNPVIGIFHIRQSAAWHSSQLTGYRSSDSTEPDQEDKRQNNSVFT